VAAGRLQVVHPGVYAVEHAMRTVEGAWMAAVLAAGKGALLSHTAAAAAWDLRRTSSGLIEVTACSRSRRRLGGVVVHQTRSFHADEVARVDGIPATSVARTLLDSAAVLPLRQVARMLEQAERLRLFDLRAIDELLGRSRGRHGVKLLRVAIAAVEGEPPRVNSDWERAFLDFCEDHGLPKPQLNAIVEGYEVDALWKDQKLIVELDSYSFHRHRTAFEDDRRKDGTLQLAGYIVLRITWRRFETEPEELARLLRPRVAA
jgi:very-short-patch-repair endonuclease